MRFHEEIAAWPAERVRALMAQVSPAEVERALAGEECDARALAALLSPQAEAYLEPMAREAQRLTRWHFGRTIGLYVPLYLSNICGADCTYCGYSVRSGHKEQRITLTESQLRAECQALRAQGFRHVLLLTGEAPRAVRVEDLARSVAVAREYFPSVSVEIYALEQAEYAQLVERGLEGVTLYMETYDRATYAQVHLTGKKRDYAYRLDAIERAGRAGVRRLSIGALLGLFDWRVDAFHTALHGRYLQRVCWQSAIAVSFPRLRHVPERFHIPRLVADREMVQLMLALRIFLPEAGFNVSTREKAVFRDRLIPLGATQMSAGSSTRPGGYASTGAETLEQFEIEDARSVAEVAGAIRAAGYDPVWKDFDHAFDGAPRVAP